MAGSTSFVFQNMNFLLDAELFLFSFYQACYVYIFYFPAGSLALPAKGYSGFKTREA